MSEARATRNFPVTWDELHRDTLALAWRLSEIGPFRGIVAVARGGLVPAAIVARELDIRLVLSVSVASYDDRIQGKARLLGTPPASDLGDGEGLLVVDDLADTGVTARLVRNLLPRAHIATVYAKPAGRPRVDSFVTLVGQDTWIVFPWDTETPIRAPRPIARMT